jgi:hypothetical protein
MHSEMLIKFDFDIELVTFYDIYQTFIHNCEEKTEMKSKIEKLSL